MIDLSSAERAELERTLNRLLDARNRRHITTWSIDEAERTDAEGTRDVVLLSLGVVVELHAGEDEEILAPIARAALAAETSGASGPAPTGRN